MNRLIGIFIALAGALLWLAACQQTSVPPMSPTAASSDIGGTLTISAASNVQPAFSELSAQFEKETGTHIVFNFGATGTLAQQIAQGAPVDLFAAADRSTVDDLAARGFILPDTVRVYARGRIAIYTRGDSPLQVSSLSDLAKPEVKRIAIANPQRAPYGAAARQAMQNAGVWSAVESKIILAENIQQTLQYADTGSVDVAVVALSLASGSKGRWSLVPQELHTPIDQALGIVKETANERAARAFAAWVTRPESQAIFEKYGYEPAK